MGNQTIASDLNSTAMGYSTNASGSVSTAMGFQTRAAGQNSTAMGDDSYAYGYASTAMGFQTLAAGQNSTAMGDSSYAYGYASIAMGFQNYATNNASIAIGTQNNSNGQNAIAIGTGNTAYGQYSTAMGTKINASTSGSFGIGDLEFSNAAADITNISGDNEFVTRFRGGYFLISSANAPSGSQVNRTGVKLQPGQNSWSAISDVRRKENFAPIDGEDFLIKIATMPLTSWNYKAQDPTIFRHYGPMAQDFFAAFGKDKYGTIGCDTLINQQDFLGVSFVAIQALEKRTTDLNKENETLKNEMLLLKKEMEELKGLLQKK